MSPLLTSYKIIYCKEVELLIMFISVTREIEVYINCHEILILHIKYHSSLTEKSMIMFISFILTVSGSICE